MATTRITFLGAAGTVTGSRTLLETQGKKLLVDCGLFQGRKEDRLKNWDPFPVPVDEIDGIFLTHAHIDHTGFLPRLKRQGYEGPVWCTAPTADLARILLPDTGHLQEEEARWANKRGYSKHRPAKPLFDQRDAEATLPLLKPVPYGAHVRPTPHLRAKYQDVGHILGAGFLDIKSDRVKDTRKICFSGDLGRPHDMILRPPSQPYNVDYLILESTYGNRLHDEHDLREALAAAIRAGVERGGVIVVPAFAVGRAQSLLFVIRELEAEGAIPELDVYLDSPMAQNALRAHQAHTSDLNLDARKLTLRGIELFKTKRLHITQSRDQSIAINKVKERAVIISASGMATGGRILHHLSERLPHAENTVLLIGYQAQGTRGRALLEGKESIRMFGGDVPVRAHVERIEGFSGHADYEEILAWLLGFNQAPERVFLVHGEPEAREALAGHIRKQFQWDVTVPNEGDSFILDF